MSLHLSCFHCTRLLPPPRWHRRHWHQIQMCEKCEIPLPHDLTVHSFSAGNVEYADDCDLFGTDLDGLSRTIDLLHSVCTSIGLDISVKKTEWICLHNPDTASLCTARRQPVPSCEQIQLGGIPTKHSPFQVASSQKLEEFQLRQPAAWALGKAMAFLNKASNYWSSPVSTRAKCKSLNPGILPVLEYATECGNHVQADIKSIDNFLNTCLH